MLLNIKDLHVSYGKIKAIKGISLEVPAGEIVTLVGANGAGKTTLLKTISGLLQPASGSIDYEGKPLSDIKPFERVVEGICQAPEGRGIFPGMTVLENLEMGKFSRVAAKSENAQDLEMVYNLFPRLKERANQAGGTLSGGEQQMLAIGRALMSRPRLLLLDEPSMGLAPKFIAQIFEIIQEIKKQNVTILLVEQNAAKALTIADRAYVLETGYITMQGSGVELLNDPKVRQAYLGHGA
ncbi:LivF ABC-type branched-chain amino acid transport systems, ATPase component [Candidatus Nanopelagicaceae bacterium]